MTSEKGFFYPHFFIFFNFENILFHNHLLFFQNLFDFLIIHKSHFFIAKEQVSTGIINIFYNYVNTNMHGSPLKPYFNNIIHFLIQNKNSSQNIYNYCIELCGVIFFLSFYRIAILEFHTIDYNDPTLYNKIHKICEQFSIKAKKIIIFDNKHILKGMQLFFKNIHIDMSLKKILYCYEEKILL